MRRVTNSGLCFPAIALMLLCAASCAGPATLPAAPVAAQTMGIIANGTLVAARQVDLSSDHPGAAAGVNAVLAALREPSASGAVAGEEFVVMKSDGNAAAFGNPSAGTVAAVGGQVAIVDGDPVVLIRR